MQPLMLIGSQRLLAGFCGQWLTHAELADCMLLQASEACSAVSAVGFRCW
jgi:hypothetical protein